MLDWAGLILGQNPHCTEVNSSQMPEICSGGDRLFWNRVVHYTLNIMSDLKGNSQFCFPESPDVSRDDLQDYFFGL